MFLSNIRAVKTNKFRKNIFSIENEINTCEKHKHSKAPCNRNRCIKHKTDHGLKAGNNFKGM